MENKLYIKSIYILFQILICFPTFGYKIINQNLSQVPNDIPFFDENEKKCYLEEYERDTILLVFWATWSNSCNKNLVDLDNLQKDFRKLPFKVLAISQDFQGIKIIKDFFEINEIRYLDIYIDPKNQLFKAFNVVGIPSSFLINQDGKIVLSFIGEINWFDEEIRNTLLNYIPGVNSVPRNSYKSKDLNNEVKFLKQKNILKDKKMLETKINDKPN